MNYGFLAFKMVQQNEHWFRDIYEEHVGEAHYQIVFQKLLQNNTLSFSNIFLLTRLDSISELRSTKIQTPIVLFHPLGKSNVHAEPGVAYGRDGVSLQPLLTTGLLIFSLSVKRIGAQVGMPGGVQFGQVRIQFRKNSLK